MKKGTKKIVSLILSVATAFSLTACGGGSAPAPTTAAPAAATGPERDNLDDLLAFGRQFDNIIIKE